jgi:large subunit ribosomal protein L25
MKSITIKGSQRESVGKVATKALRNAEKVPCVLYGGGTSIHFSADTAAFKNLVYTPNVYTTMLELESGTFHAMMQDIQFHPVSDKILHIDFYQLADDRMVTIAVPVRLTGVSPGVLAGGSLRHNFRKISIKALPANLPDFIEVDISVLKIGDKLCVSSIKNDKYEILQPDNSVIVQVRTSRNAVADTEEEESSEA